MSVTRYVTQQIYVYLDEKGLKPLCWNLENSICAKQSKEFVFDTLTQIMSLIFEKQQPTTCRVDLHSVAARFQRSDISHSTKRTKMIEGVKIITLEGTTCDKDFHYAPRISRLLYCEQSLSFLY